MTTDSESDSSDSYVSARQTRRTKRRKVTQKGHTRAVAIKAQEPSTKTFTINPLLKTLHELTAEDWKDDSDTCNSFESILEPVLPELCDADRMIFGQGDGKSPLLSRQDAAQLSAQLHHRANSEANSILSCMLAAKLRLHSRVLRKVVLNRDPPYPSTGSLTPLHLPRTLSAGNLEVINALNAIRTTSYENSFLSRLQGFQPSRQTGVVAVDWETRTPWTELMSDIREHHALAHPEREQAQEMVAPITYCTLQRCHLAQVHDLLGRAFWEGIDVSDSLNYSPERCTVITTYGQLVVGAAFLSSPQETYITYLAVRSGWDNSQIATTMLYHLITLNPHKDITLHVSINNPAMLLYNRFGFKAEEFIVGFYEDYLDPNSPQSKNAFRLRLRRW